jgi:hypothetical protein
MTSLWLVARSLRLAGTNSEASARSTERTDRGPPTSRGVSARRPSAASPSQSGCARASKATSSRLPPTLPATGCADANASVTTTARTATAEKPSQTERALCCFAGVVPLLVDRLTSTAGGCAQTPLMTPLWFYFPHDAELARREIK